MCVRREKVGHSEKEAICKPRREILGEASHASTLILDF